MRRERRKKGIYKNENRGNKKQEMKNKIVSFYTCHADTILSNRALNALT